MKQNDFVELDLREYISNKANIKCPGAESEQVVVDRANMARTSEA